MISKREKLQYIYAFIADTLALLASVFLVWLVFERTLGLIVDYSNAEWMQALSSLGVAFVGAFLCFDQEQNITERRLADEVKLSVKFNILMGALYAAFMMVIKGAMLESRYFGLGVPLVNAVLFMASHILLKELLLRERIHLGLKSMVGVVTTWDRAEVLLKELKNDWTQHICGVAVLEAGSEELGTVIEGVRVEANYYGFMNWIRRSALDELYVDIPMDRGESFIPYLEEMESMGLTVHFRLPMIDRIEQKCCSETSTARMSRMLGRCAGGNILTLGTLEVKLRDRVLKRVLDIVGGIVGCLISIPIIAIVAIPLKLESPGPLIFRQKRVGLNGRYFYICKLRSMYMDAEQRKKELQQQNEMQGLMFKMHNDPRITKVGKFIRKTSIDELPQFWNVLRGEMSLVGTRPPTVDEYQQYQSHHKRRLSMKPGITGLWQVSGRSNIENFEDVVALDIKYIDNWSFWLDIKLLFQTVAVVLMGRGAE